MQALQITSLPPSAHQDLVNLYQATKLPRIRTRTQMILLSAEQGLKAPQIAQIVRERGGPLHAVATLAKRGHPL